MTSTTEIREILLDQLRELSKGGKDLDKARAISELSAQAIYSTRIELENKRLELELSKSSETVKKWMDRDFSSIQNIKG